MHCLESLGVKNSAAEAAGSCQRGGLSLAVGTDGLGHCTSRVAYG